MKIIDVKKFKYRDNLAKKRHRRFLALNILWLAGVSALVVALGYAVFFSGWFDINEISIEGLADVRADEVRSEVENKLSERWLGLPSGNNILFFPASRMESALSSRFPFIKELNINKEFFHGLMIEASERQPEGIWCFGSALLTASCSYYDHDGVLIGPAPKSSGFLTLTVNDMRAGKNSIDPKFLTAAQTVNAGLEAQGIKVKDITIPAGTFTELSAYVSVPDASVGASGYSIRFSIDTDLAVQLHALEIFLKQSLDAPTPYQYLDLRFDDRVYYK
ncbi:MAG: hypothetical protein A2941_01485 [Candidatus Yanofskybacteria bacterium RIFCSPLOWO2_01_FULL_49_17]|uniref:POTRA domain-containing protein n=1 Tax=Candidatus Yanofskybacteria bacterium RIFCSPLOWO2_01_FULL_49_17 TaxID=1802700 RepID=A0A1F8GQE0_9BACT|nr:MAG: hypothetical protein A2941_01485 [Candidatus Yanofskybacteria bacterium RIFCSPLOWO2_01_FULL_49_17]